MRSLHAARLLPAALTIAAAAAAAQGATAPPPRPVADPLEATAAVPPMVYRSTLSTFGRRAADEPVPWREANDRVGRIGGWRAYAREANAPDASVATPVDATRGTSTGALPTTKPVPAPHGGHKMH